MNSFVGYFAQASRYTRRNGRLRAGSWDADIKRVGEAIACGDRRPVGAYTPEGIFSQRKTAGASRGRGSVPRDFLAPYFMKKQPTKKKSKNSKTESAASFARRIGISPQGLQHHVKASEDAPPIGDVDAWIKFLAVHGREGSAPPDLRRKIASARHRLLAAQAAREEIRLQRESGQMVPKAEVREGLAAAQGLLFQTLDRVFLNELPPVLQGLSAKQMRDRMTTEIEAVKGAWVKAMLAIEQAEANVFEEDDGETQSVSAKEKQ